MSRKAIQRVKPVYRGPLPAAPRLDGRIRYLFGYAGGGRFPWLTFSYWIARGGGLPVSGWSHVMPMLADGSIIDAYEDWVCAPVSGWKVSGYPQAIPPGVRHRPHGYYVGARTSLVEIPVTLEQQREWEAFLWDGIDAPYDESAIFGFLEGKNLHKPGARICSAWGKAAARRIKLLGGPIPDHEWSPDALWIALVSPVALKARIPQTGGVAV